MDYEDLGEPARKRKRSPGAPRLPGIAQFDNIPVDDYSAADEDEDDDLFVRDYASRPIHQPNFRATNPATLRSAPAGYNRPASYGNGQQDINSAAEEEEDDDLFVRDYASRPILQPNFRTTNAATLSSSPAGYNRPASYGNRQQDINSAAIRRAAIVNNHARNMMAGNFGDAMPPPMPAGPVTTGFASPAPSPAPVTSPSTTIIGSQRAHEMKMALGNTTVAPTPTNARRRIPEQDPENHIIKRMRAVEQKSWAEIARHLNEERIKAGKSPTFTEAAIYGRFVRNGPRIAAAEGDTNFNPRDFMHLRGVNEAASARAVNNAALVGGQERFDTAHDEALVESFMEVQKAFWDNVATVLEQKTGRKYQPLTLADRYRLL